MGMRVSPATIRARHLAKRDQRTLRAASWLRTTFAQAANFSQLLPNHPAFAAHLPKGCFRMRSVNNPRPDSVYANVWVRVVVGARGELPNNYSETSNLLLGTVPGTSYCFHGKYSSRVRRSIFQG